MWPPPIYQPDPMQDCEFYAFAYACLLHGHEVGGEQVKMWCKTAGVVPWRYPKDHGLVVERPHPSPLDTRFWLGPGTRSWVEEGLDAGKVAVAAVFVRPERDLHHAVTLIDYDDHGVLVMDPVWGHRRHRWEWFLGPGPGQDCHYIEAWVSRPDHL